MCTRHFPWRPRSFDPALRLQTLIGQDRPSCHARWPLRRIDVNSCCSRATAHLSQSAGVRAGPCISGRNFVYILGREDPHNSRWCRAACLGGRMRRRRRREVGEPADHHDGGFVRRGTGATASGFARKSLWRCGIHWLHHRPQLRLLPSSRQVWTAAVATGGTSAPAAGRVRQQRSRRRPACARGSVSRRPHRRLRNPGELAVADAAVGVVCCWGGTTVRSRSCPTSIIAWSERDSRA